MNTSAKYSRQGSVGTLKLIGDQMVSGAEALRACALAALGDASAKSIRLDVSKAGRIDGAGWQILMALNRDAVAAGREVAVHPADGGVVQSARNLGISLGNPASE